MEAAPSRGWSAVSPGWMASAAEGPGCPWLKAWGAGPGIRRAGGERHNTSLPPHPTTLQDPTVVGQGLGAGAESQDQCPYLPSPPSPELWPPLFLPQLALFHLLEHSPDPKMIPQFFFPLISNKPPSGTAWFSECFHKPYPTEWFDF